MLGKFGVQRNFGHLTDFEIASVYAAMSKLLGHHTLPQSGRECGHVGSVHPTPMFDDSEDKQGARSAALVVFVIAGATAVRISSRRELTASPV